MERANIWIKKARASWWDDGVVEAVVGSGLILIGTVGILSSRLGGGIGAFLNLLRVVLLLVLVLTGNRIVRAIKARFVWPEYGYASPARRRSGGIFVLVAILFFILSIMFYRSPSGDFLISVVPFSIFVEISRFSGLRRFYFAGIFSILTGIFLAACKVNFSDAVELILITSGIFLLVTGVISWKSFRRKMESRHG